MAAVHLNKLIWSISMFRLLQDNWGVCIVQGKKYWPVKHQFSAEDKVYYQIMEFEARGEPKPYVDEQASVLMFEAFNDAINYIREQNLKQLLS